MKTFSFVKHMKGHSSKTNKDYNFVELSDGKRSFTINVSKDATIGAFDEGDEVTPIVEIYGNRDGYAGVTLVDLS